MGTKPEEIPANRANVPRTFRLMINGRVGAREKKKRFVSLVGEKFIRARVKRLDANRKKILWMLLMPHNGKTVYACIVVRCHVHPIGQPIRGTVHYLFFSFHSFVTYLSTPLFVISSPKIFGEKPDEL